MGSNGSSFDALRTEARAAVEAGRMRDGLELFERALERARESGDSTLIDLALCNRAMVAIELGEGNACKPELRRILVNNADPKNCFLAAYHLARAYELEKNLDKALFYSRIALRYGPQVGSRQAACHNQVGNLLVALSEFEAAEVELGRALELLPEEPSVRRALVLENLGYCHVVQGRSTAGFRAHFAALRMLRRLGARVYECHPHVSLCFAYLQLGRYRPAIRHGSTGLRLAEEVGNSDLVKTALFLLGQAFKQGGDPLTAHRYFQRLQEEYYPNAPGVPDLLLLMNVMNVVNIKA